MRWKVTIVVVLSSIFAGCSTYPVPRYSASASTVESLRANAPARASVGTFTATGENRSEITCRGVGPIKAADGETFADYAKKALMSELRMAGLYSDAAPVTLTGNVTHLDFSSTEGHWDIGLTVTSSNGATVSQTVKHNYPVNFAGEVACNTTAQAFMPAMQDAISAVVSDPNFPALLKADPPLAGGR
ncbi:hypothetical protein [Cupriavidus sp.]|uniref:hypothetical protein n=1 Tax=Cupriavidus sp. TaxID=1873897 RepID=UPI0025C2052B|nr:hypothetical protein [Cupriavidus sp.]MCA3186305.1 hypothetical protein [Cupriavidus sp.]MCA3190945.1 hypothetical protein [Cupriavidus sp.]MCA3199289.1 hypothetical protein [Cupriavidus sp.]MCA3204556.1 hypothetical protein [Cupriavidus sp.]MCA3207745.1 hypothetical protein [Cupriavidus sp.]